MLVKRIKKKKLLDINPHLWMIIFGIYFEGFLSKVYAKHLTRPVLQIMLFCYA